MQIQALAHTPLFEGLPPAALEEIASRMRARHVEAREVICREGEPGKSLFVIERGLAHIMVSSPETGRLEPVARLRRGDVVGEMSLLTGEPRSATVVAGVPTDILELDQDTFTALLAQYPAILVNLNRILSRRLARTNIRAQSRSRGESITLAVGDAASSLVPAVVSATAAASPRPVAVLDLREDAMDGMQHTVAGALGVLDDLLAAHGTVLIVSGLDGSKLPILRDNTDRVVALVNGGEIDALDASCPSSPGQRTELILLRNPAYWAEVVEVTADEISLVRRIREDPPSSRDIAWIGRHLARTKLGLALGAGGAKGYAHVGALQVLEDAGYTVDYVSGSSIGAVVGTWLALGQSAEEIEATMLRTFSPDNVAAMFQISMSGLSTGLDVTARAFRETVGDHTFADLDIPLTMMCVDLNTKQPAPITDGPLLEGMLAAIALAGLFPPYERNGQRLVDGLALVPVPTGSVVEAGADLTVSCNIMSREVLPAWPGEQPPEAAPAKGRMRMLDTLLEVMDLAQLDSSIRHAALADVVITPRFGPSSWREFHLADLFLAAGRAAAEEQLPSLRALARPQPIQYSDRGEVDGAAVHI